MNAQEFQSLAVYLAGTPAAIEQLAEGLTDEAERWRASGLEFSVLEHVCHLLDIEREGYAVRIERILGEDHPTLSDIDGSRLALERDYNSQNMGAALEGFRLAREGNVRTLKSLAPDQLERRGMLETVGPLALSDLIIMMRDHDESHRQEIIELRNRLSGRTDASSSR